MPGTVWPSAATWNSWDEVGNLGRSDAKSPAATKRNRIGASVAHARPFFVGSPYDAASTSQVTVSGTRITMRRAMPCSTMNGNAPL